jgi:hypothetical protein
MPLRYFLLLAVSGATITFGGGRGPFCWAGYDETGKDQFIVCHPKREQSLPRIDLDVEAFNGILICTDGQCITVSRGQFLTAVAEWQRAENPAMP